MEFDKIAASLSAVCEEEGVCLPTIPGVKEARYMQRDDGENAVLCCLWDDGSVTSCHYEGKETKCCETEANAGTEAYHAWVDHLVGVGYHEQVIKVDEP